jgi:predicted O-methyltransferase YrrM
MNKWIQLQKWLHYRNKSKTKYGIHSPFVFKLVTEVLEDKFLYPEYFQVEKIMKQLQKNDQIIRRKDWGAGNNPSEYPINVSTIASKQCVKKRYGRLLFRLVKYFSPYRILELGTSIGISTSYLTLARPESQVYTIEGCPETFAIAQAHPLLAENINVNMICGRFDEVLCQQLQKNGVVDFAFIDGDHRKESTIGYFNKILNHIQNNSLLVFDDIHWSEGMEEAWEVIKRNEKVKVTIDLFQFGLVFFKKELSKEDFVIRY